MHNKLILCPSLLFGTHIPHQLLGISLLIAHSCIPHWELFLALGSRLIQNQPPLGKQKTPWFRDTSFTPTLVQSHSKRPSQLWHSPRVGDVVADAFGVRFCLEKWRPPPLPPYRAISLGNPPIHIQQAARRVTLRPKIFISKYNKEESRRGFTAENLSIGHCDADTCPY